MTGEATVVKNAGSHYMLSRLPEWDLFPAVLRGKVRLENSGSTNPVAIGDRVIYETDGETTEQNPAVIKEILPRRNHLVRKSVNLSKRSQTIAANLDRAVIVVSLLFPELKWPFLDRILVTCGVYGIPAVIALNKVDLYRDEAPELVESFKEVYEGAGYRVIQTSSLTGEGIEELREECRERLSLFSGESGVGKSSLIKAIDPSLTPKTGSISAAHLQGRHTTSLSAMYRLSGGGYVIDTPGIRGFGLVNLEREEIYKYFPEMLRYSDDCRFVPCTHTHEPDCAVKQAVDEGLISPERYNSYLGMLEENGQFR